jgi:hypothetical protein
MYKYSEIGFFSWHQTSFPSKWEWFPPEMHQSLLVPPSLCTQKKKPCLEVHTWRKNLPLCPITFSILHYRLQNPWKQGGWRSLLDIMAHFLVESLTPKGPCSPKWFWPLWVTLDEASKIAVIFWNFYWE